MSLELMALILECDMIQTRLIVRNHQHRVKTTSEFLKNGRALEELARSHTCIARGACVAARLANTGWWSQPGSNRRPPACKAGALPAELWPLIALTVAWQDWWVWEELNLRPHPYQGCALTN